MNSNMLIKEKLNAYRRQKRKEEMTESIKNALHFVLPWNGSKMTEKENQQTLISEVSPKEDVRDTESNCSDENLGESSCTSVKIITNILYFLLWATIYIIAIEFEFGAVYFVLSTLFFIWLNTNSRPKKQGELSAYSVFNPNCEAIEGTLDASQFEKEIRYGIGGMH